MRAILLIAITACSGSGGALCGPAGGTVSRVVDGDTIELATGDKVRYLMINAPENTQGHIECFGPEAAQANSDLVLGKDVTLQYDVDCQDMYGRWLAYVSVGDIEVNTRMVERGYACVLHIPPNGDDRLAEFDGLQQEAMTANRGIWANCDIAGISKCP